MERIVATRPTSKIRTTMKVWDSDELSEGVGERAPGARSKEPNKKEGWMRLGSILP